MPGRVFNGWFGVGIYHDPILYHLLMLFLVSVCKAMYVSEIYIEPTQTASYFFADCLAGLVTKLNFVTLFQAKLHFTTPRRIR
ncbi:MAG: hypothetical protein BWX80_02273 [Candidatus Hydrogenedentes bacterium ADurb.Bin101]|nr:MAG: hypothetical protein BWX80_02273 [Candidatus Hydrogenedentes bacterium ADurb.Bin101]